ncbi:MAG TPA: hypothetical protein VGW78_06395 [Candidatus Babeliales bacterium]|jgi:hypothetical protein|nr:hypothetical protein [Candidatus Babeliales bacterium]
MFKRMISVFGLVLLASNSVLFSKDPHIYTIDGREYVIEDHMLQPKDPKIVGNHAIVLHWDANKKEMVKGESFTEAAALGAGLVGVPAMGYLMSYFAKRSNTLGVVGSSVGALIAGSISMGSTKNMELGKYFAGVGTLIGFVVGAVAGYAPKDK